MFLKTKRLKIIPLTIEQMSLLCEGQDKLEAFLGLSPSGVGHDSHLKAAFLEMYRLCMENPKYYLWYTNWQIILKDENKSIGSIAFRNIPNKKHEVEIGYGINELYRNNGYATEALKKLCEWAFSIGVYYIQAKTEINNEASIKVLEKCGFKQTGKNEEVAFYELEKPKSSWMSIYMFLGLSIGLCFGTTLYNNSAISMCIGMTIGIAIGTSLDVADKNNRKR